MSYPKGSPTSKANGEKFQYGFIDPRSALYCSFTNKCFNKELQYLWTYHYEHFLALTFNLNYKHIWSMNTIEAIGVDFRVKKIIFDYSQRSQ